MSYRRRSRILGNQAEQECADIPALLRRNGFKYNLELNSKCTFHR